MPGWLSNVLLRLSGSAAFTLGATIVTAAASQPPATLPGIDPRTDESYHIVISVADQRLALLKDHEVVAVYRVSTSRFGVGDEYASYRTPLGAFRIREKIGGELSPGAVLKDRAATGELLLPDAAGRTAIVSRILSLEGMEVQNRNAGDRGIYIHGTAEEAHLGQPMSWGCVRMSSHDVIDLFHAVPLGTGVDITTEPLPLALLLLTREKNSFGKAQPLTLENSQAAIPARFTDMCYTALLQYRLSHTELSINFSDSNASAQKGRLASTSRRHDPSASKPIRPYDHH